LIGAASADWHDRDIGKPQNARTTRVDRPDILAAFCLTALGVLFAFAAAAVIVWKCEVLNFIQPYCVTTYAAARNEARLRANDPDVRISIGSRLMSREGNSGQHRGQ
jgi:hypothetical protein